MSKLSSFTRNFLTDDGGAALAEYVALFVIIAIAGTAGMLAMGTQIGNVFTNMNTWLETNVNGNLNGGGGT